MIDLPDTFMKQDGDHSSHTRAEDLESYIVTEPNSFFIMQGHTSSDQEDLYDEDSGTCEMNQDATGNWEFLTESSIELDYGIDSYEVDYSISENVLTLTIDEGEGEYQERYEKQ